MSDRLPSVEGIQNAFNAGLMDCHECCELLSLRIDADYTGVEEPIFYEKVWDDYGVPCRYEITLSGWIEDE